MGDGKKLKEYLDEKGTNVRRIAKETGISDTTLYTLIQKDSNIRFDFAPVSYTHLFKTIVVFPSPGSPWIIVSFP